MTDAGSTSARVNKVSRRGPAPGSRESGSECFCATPGLPRAVGLLVRFASQWVAGETMAESLTRAEEANRRGLGAILNLLGEHHTEPAAVDAAVREYLELLDAIQARNLDACLSIKPTQCGLMLGEDAYWKGAKTILDRVRTMHGFLWMDMEGSRFTDATLAVYRRALAEYPEVVPPTVLGPASHVP